ncbi:MAG: hypothetical protein AAF648_10015 [Pseudomonadota bacterium]
MALILAGSAVVPAPAGVDVTDPESISAGIDQFEARHFVFPWLAHAAGTFVGALVAVLVAPLRQRAAAWTVVGFFLLGGIANFFMIPAPVAFIVMDLAFAYLPMGALALLNHGRASSQRQP